MTLDMLLRLAGVSLIALALSHALLWRVLDWKTESQKLSKLNGAIFSVHAFFVAFVLLAMGLLSLRKPELFLQKSELATWLLLGTVAFWTARLLLQVLLFERLMRQGILRAWWLRLGALALFGYYVLVYGAALAGQLRAAP